MVVNVRQLAKLPEEPSTLQFQVPGQRGLLDGCFFDSDILFPRLGVGGSVEDRVGFRKGVHRGRNVQFHRTLVNIEPAGSRAAGLIRGLAIVGEDRRSYAWSR